MAGGGEVGAVKPATVRLSAADAKAAVKELWRIEVSDKKAGFSADELAKAKDYLAKLGITAEVTEAMIKRFRWSVWAAAEAAARSVVRDVEIATFDGSYVFANAKEKIGCHFSSGGVLKKSTLESPPVSSTTISTASAKSYVNDLKNIEVQVDEKEGFWGKEIAYAKEPLAELGITEGVNDATIKRFMSDVSEAVKVAESKFYCEYPWEVGMACCRLGHSIEIVTIYDAYDMVTVDGHQVVKEPEAGKYGPDREKTAKGRDKMEPMMRIEADRVRFIF